MKRILVSALLTLVPGLALAESDKEPPVAFTEACSFTCVSGGWELVDADAEDIDPFTYTDASGQVQTYDHLEREDGEDGEVSGGGKTRPGINTTDR